MVVAIRQSGAAFTGMYNLRSTTFARYLQERDNWTGRFEKLQQQLADDLYAAVPQQLSNRARAILLKAKRDVWNSRPVSLSLDLQIGDRTLALISEYNCVRSNLSELLISLLPAIIAELRGNLRQLIQEPSFRSAVIYACPWLIDAYERRSFQPAAELSNEERGIFSYAVKFFSKANPLHLFASIGLLSGSPYSKHGFCEVAIDTAFVLNLENATLAGISDQYRRFVCLSVYSDEGNVWRFLISNGMKCQLVSIKSSARLAKLAAFLNAPVPRSVGACLDELSTHDGGTREELARYLSNLLSHRILTEFLVWDFRRFAEQLRGCNPALDEPLAFLDDVHLKPIQENCLPSIELKLRQVDIPQAGKPVYYVNSYSDAIRPAQYVLDPIVEDLRCLKPFFASMANTATRVRDLTSVVCRHLDRYPNLRAPYLTLLYECLRHSDIPAVEGDTPFRPRLAESEELEHWVHNLSQLEGQVEESDLASFRPDAAPLSTSAVCFNGPINACSGMFFPSNSFSGGSRFVSRYFLGEAADWPRQSANFSPGEVLDVQLVLPLTDNRMFVRPIYRTGCGFERRYRYDFEQWIDPSEITVENENGKIRYRHTATSRLMRIHYLGFFRSELLTPEYGLLLLAHADSYTNPFAAFPSTKQITTGSGIVQHVSPLSYGKVCLRREEFRLPVPVIQEPFDSKDFLSASLRFRDILHSITGTKTDHWYFRTSRIGKGGFKPRYLDLGNPFSSQLLIRDIAASDKEALVSFSRMDPPIDQLPLHDNHRYTTEFMIEV